MVAVKLSHKKRNQLTLNWSPHREVFQCLQLSNFIHSRFHAFCRINNNGTSYLLVGGLAVYYLFIDRSSSRDFGLLQFFISVVILLRLWSTVDIYWNVRFKHVYLFLWYLVLVWNFCKIIFLCMFLLFFIQSYTRTLVFLNMSSGQTTDSCQKTVMMCEKFVSF